MASAQFKLPIGAKCQVTIPKQCMGLLSLSVGDDLLLEVEDDHAVLHPMVSIPRRELPEELWKKFEARRGAKATDVPLKTLLNEVGYRAAKAPERSTRPARQSAGRGASKRGPLAKGRVVLEQPS
jgi:bifunctional DNA-binding transcriptional regulator/antitoxin component of YhaV-PrlF toxin-antitoxin module